MYVLVWSFVIIVVFFGLIVSVLFVVDVVCVFVCCVVLCCLFVCHCVGRLLSFCFVFVCVLVFMLLCVWL